jgi:hypothetical protein
MVEGTLARSSGWSHGAAAPFRVITQSATTGCPLTMRLLLAELDDEDVETLAL